MYTITDVNKPCVLAEITIATISRVFFVRACNVFRGVTVVRWNNVRKKTARESVFISQGRARVLKREHDERYVRYFDNRSARSKIRDTATIASFARS